MVRHVFAEMSYWFDSFFQTLGVLLVELVALVDDFGKRTTEDVFAHAVPYGRAFLEMLQRDDVSRRIAQMMGPVYYRCLYDDLSSSEEDEFGLAASYEYVMNFLFSNASAAVDESLVDDSLVDDSLVDERRLDRFVARQRSRLDAALQRPVGCGADGVNAHIAAVFYDKTRFESQTEAERAALAAAWKSRALMVASPLLSQANVLMYYDTDQLGFAYHSDFVVASPVLLNALAMNYVVQFRCLDFFVDEVVLPERASPLLPLHAVVDEAENKKKNQDKEEGADFQAFVKEHSHAFVQRKPAVDKERKVLPAIVVRNHFVYKGKVSDYSFVQKMASVPVPLVAKKEALFGVRPSFDCLFEDVLGRMEPDVEVVESAANTPLDYKTFKKRGLLRRLLGRS